MSTQLIRCPSCDKKLKIASKPGAKVRCRSCSAVFQLPEESSAPQADIATLPPPLPAPTDELTVSPAVTHTEAPPELSAESHENLDERSTDADPKGSATVGYVSSDQVVSNTASFASPGTTGFSARKRGSDSAAAVELPGYEILATLGRGGMGVVYKARHLKLNRVVAVKMILSGAHAGDEQFDRFATEAQAVARLQHRGIVQIFEVSEHNDLPFFALEYCEGGSLSQKIDGTPFKPREAAKIVEELAEAMHAAHGKHIIHRDLKPANVLLTNDGSAKITDFGLAKKLEEDVGQTQSGAIMGTPSYMAPEQALGETKEIGPLADVYALGAILYELLTGRPPFKGATQVETLLQVTQTEPVPPSQLNPKTPRDLETICLKCLQKDPQKRYSSAAALAEDVGCWLDGKPIHARPTGNLERVAKWCRRNPAVASLTAIAALLLIVGTTVSTIFGLDAQAQARNAVDKADLADKQTRLARAEQLKAENLANKLTVALAEKTRQEQAAQANWMRSEWKVYAGHINVAKAAWLVRDAELLRHHLEKCRWDFRGWEHDYLWTLLKKHQLIGHTQFARSVAYSPDGKRIVSGSQDETAIIWDAETGQQLHTLNGHTGGVTSVAFGPDGKRIATAGIDKTVKIWDAFSGQLLSTLQGHDGYVWSVAISSDGKRIASSSIDKTVILWDADSGNKIHTLTGHTKAVRAVAFSPDDTRIVSASDDATLKLWDAVAGKEISNIAGHLGPVLCVAFSPDGSRIASAGRDRLVKIWDAVTARELLNLQGHNEMIEGVAFSPDSKLVASGSKDKSLRIWDAKSGRELRVFHDRTGSPSSVAFRPDGDCVATSSWDNSVKTWELVDGFPSRTIAGHSNVVTQVAFTPAGEQIASVCSDQTLRLWDASTLKEILKVPGSARGLAISPDGQQIASSGRRDKTVRICNAVNGQNVHFLSGHTNEVTAMAFSPDGKTIVSASADKTLKLWDSATGKELFTMKGHQAEIRDVAFSADGKQIVSASKDKTLRIWETSTGKTTIILKGHMGEVATVECSADGKWIASGGDDKTLKLWDPATGKEVLTLKGHTKAVQDVAFSPDSKRIISASIDNTVRLWDISGQETLTLTLDYPVHCVAFSPDGKQIVSGGQGNVGKGGRTIENMLKLWDAPASQYSFTLEHPGFVNGVAFSPDRKRLVSACGDTTLKLWNMTTGAESLVFHGHTDPVTSVDYHPDGGQIISGSADKTLKLWDPATAQTVQTLEGHTGAVTSVAFRFDGKRIVSGSDDNTAKVWDAGNSQATLTLEGHSARVTGVDFSPDGKRITTSSWDKTVKLWDADNGKELFTLEGHTDRVYGVAFSPDGKRVVSASKDSTLKVWDADTGKGLRTLTGHSYGVQCVALSPDGRWIFSGGGPRLLKVWNAETGAEVFSIVAHYNPPRCLTVSPDGSLVVTGSADKELKIWLLPMLAKVPATPTLLKSLADERLQTRTRAILALARQGSIVIPELTKLLTNKNPVVRESVAKTLGHMGGDAHSAIPELLPLLLSDDNAMVRAEAAQAILHVFGGMSNQDAVAKDCVKPLIGGLKHQDAVVRAASVKLLSSLGATAVADLGKALGTEDAATRQGAFQALRNMGTAAQSSTPAVLQTLQDPDVAIRQEAVKLLLGMEQTDKAVAVLLPGLKDKDAKVRLRAIMTLAEFGSKAKSAAPELKRALKDQDKAVREAAAIALDAFRGDIAPIEGELLKSDPPDDFPLTRGRYHKSHLVTLSKGRSYLIDLEGAFDTCLRIEDAKNKVVAFNDDRTPPGVLHSRLAISPEETQKFRVVVTSFSPGATGKYKLEIREAREFGEPKSIEGTVTKSDKNNMGRLFKIRSIQLTAGKSYRFDLTSKDFNTFLVLIDMKTRRPVAQNADRAPGENNNALIDFTPSTSGEYNVVVTSNRPGEVGAFLLRIQGFEPAKK